MIVAPPFLDSNILIYAYSTDRRSRAAQAICERRHTLSVQSLNEFANVARRKLGYEWANVAERLATIVDLADPIIELTFEMHQFGVALAERYKLQVYDSMIVAAAIEAGCETLYSEDMHHGLVIEDRLTILNPFV